MEERYEFIDELGAGATSAVYLVGRSDVVPQDEQEYALKAVDRPRVCGDEEAFAAVQREIQVLRELPPHPHIVGLVEITCDKSSL